MKKLLCVIVIAFFSGSFQNVLAQLEPVYFQVFTFGSEERELNVERRQLQQTGFSYEYDQQQDVFNLTVHDPLYFPNFFQKKKDGLTLQWQGDRYTLGRNQLREQFLAIYRQKAARNFTRDYASLLSKYMAVPELPLLEDSRERYRYMQNLADLANLEERATTKLAQQIEKLYKQQKHQDRDFRKFLHNRKGVPSLVRQDSEGWNLQFEVQPGSGNQLAIDFSYKNQPFATMTFDTLMGQPADFLEQQEMADCYPFNRYTYFKKLRGLGLGNFYYQKHQPQESYTGYRTFIVPFAKNSSAPTPGDLKEIIDLMQDSAFVIQKARAFAYASVEGLDSINKRLQGERLQVILDILQQRNQDSIEIVQQEAAENWDLFYQQIENGPLNYWKELTRAEVKEKLTRPVYLGQLEDSLAKQRYAKLDLLMSKTLTLDDQLRQAYKLRSGILRAYKKLPETRHYENQKAQLMGKFLGVQMYLDSLARENRIELEVACQGFHVSGAAFEVMQFDYLMWQQSHGLKPVCNNEPEILQRSWQACMENIRNSTSSSRTRYWQRKMTDIQNYAFEQIESGALEPEILCVLIWDNHPNYFPLMLNEMSYLEDKDDEFLYEMSCYRQDTTQQPEQEVEYAWDRENPHAIAFGKPGKVKVPHTGYYNILKKTVLEGDGISEWVVRSDEILEFDLYEFLYYSILHWDTWNGIYYDQEVDYKVMMKQMQRLMDISEILCPTQLYQLYLDLHLRVSLLARQNNEVKKEALSSLKTLNRYFINNLAWLKEEEAKKLSQHLVWMGKYYHKNETYEMAYELIGRMKKYGIADSW